MRRLWSTAVLALVVVGLASGEDVCRLQVHAVDMFGRPLPLALFRLDTDERKYKTGTAWEVPCGEHTISVEAHGFYQTSSKVRIDEGFQLKTFGLQLGELGGGPRIGPDSRITTFEIAGFEAYPGCDKLRLMSFFDARHTYDSLVSSAGRAGLMNVPAGYYLAVLSGEKGVCGTAVVPVPRYRNVTMRLSPVE